MDKNCWDQLIYLSVYVSIYLLICLSIQISHGYKARYEQEEGHHPVPPVWGYLHLQDQTANTRRIKT